MELIMKSYRGFVLFASILASPLVFADHNSPHGAGWANMPNDVHNMRVDTRESGDYEAFRDFVRFGQGAQTPNRFLPDSALIAVPTLYETPLQP
jgi:hypothetical protein